MAQDQECVLQWNALLRLVVGEVRCISIFLYIMSFFFKRDVWAERYFLYFGNRKSLLSTQRKDAGYQEILFASIER